MKIEIAQISTKEASIERNTAKIISSIDHAKKSGADLVIFPELTVPGYSSMDWFRYPEFVEHNKDALRRITQETDGIAAIVGFVDQDESIIGPDDTTVKYNSAAFLKDGQLVSVIDKRLLPEYDVFPEKRYFSAARDGERVIDVNGVKVGVEICEDLWSQHYGEDVTDELNRMGADIFVNISASPFYIDKLSARAKLIEDVVKKYSKPFIYTNLAGSQDGYDGQLIFDGQSVVYGANGDVIGFGKSFEEDHFLVDLDNPNSVEVENLEPVEQVHKALVLATKEYVQKSGNPKVVIGLSGGIDSAVTAALAVEALGKDRVIGVTMPTHISGKDSVEDAQELAENLGIKFIVCPIEEQFQAAVNALESNIAQMGEEPSKKDKGLAIENIQARIRGMELMKIANAYKMLVISTGNKTELELGYCTLYGDMVGGFGMLGDLRKKSPEPEKYSKPSVYTLAEEINRKRALEGLKGIPERTITKLPTADLAPGQTDEEGLGGKYEILSPIADSVVEDMGTIEKLSKIYRPEDVINVWDRLMWSEYKRRQNAPSGKLTKKSFGIGRRFPIFHEVKI